MYFFSRGWCLGPWSCLFSPIVHLYLYRYRYHTSLLLTTQIQISSFKTTPLPTADTMNSSSEQKNPMESSLKLEGHTLDLLITWSYPDAAANPLSPEAMSLESGFAEQNRYQASPEPFHLVSPVYKSSGSRSDDSQNEESDVFLPHFDLDGQDIFAGLDESLADTYDPTLDLSSPDPSGSGNGVRPMPVVSKMVQTDDARSSLSPLTVEQAMSEAIRRMFPPIRYSQIQKMVSEISFPFLIDATSNVDPQVLDTGTNKPEVMKKTESACESQHAEGRAYIYSYTDKDVLMGRGGHARYHPGNQWYLAEKTQLQKVYLTLHSREEKTKLSKQLAESVYARGGRFLEIVSKGKYVEVDSGRARLKASQALREVLKM
jgi:hypothetical protein